MSVLTVVKTRAAVLFILIFVSMCRGVDSVAAAEMKELIQAESDALQQLSLSIFATPGKSSSSSRIVLTVTLSNKTAADIIYPSAHVFLVDNSLEVRDEAGKSVQPNHALVREPIASLRPALLRSGFDLTENIAVNEFGYDLGPGRYSVRVVRSGLASNVLPLRSNEVLITILP